MANAAETEGSEAEHLFHPSEDGFDDRPSFAIPRAATLLVVSASIHMSKCMEKLASWGSYLPHAATDPTGTRTAAVLADGAASTPPPLVSMRLVSMLAAFILVVMAGFALRESRLADPQGSRSRVVPLVCASLIGIVIVLYW